MELKELLIEYNKITIEAINNVKNKIDIEELVNKREELIENIKKINYKKEELQGIVKDLNIIDNEKELNNFMIKWQSEIKNELDLIRKRKLARSNYGNQIAKPTYFNKRI